MYKKIILNEDNIKNLVNNGGLVTANISDSVLCDLAIGISSNLLFDSTKDYIIIGNKKLQPNKKLGFSNKLPKRTSLVFSDMTKFLKIIKDAQKYENYSDFTANDYLAKEYFQEVIKKAGFSKDFTPKIRKLLLVKLINSNIPWASEISGTGNGASASVVEAKWEKIMEFVLGRKTGNKKLLETFVTRHLNRENSNFIGGLIHKQEVEQQETAAYLNQQKNDAESVEYPGY